MTPPYGMLTPSDDMEDWGLGENPELEEEMEEKEPKFRIELYRDEKLLAVLEKDSIKMNEAVFPRIAKTVHDMWALVFRPEKK